MGTDEISVNLTGQLGGGAGIYFLESKGHISWESKSPVKQIRGPKSSCVTYVNENLLRRKEMSNFHLFVVLE